MKVAIAISTGTMLIVGGYLTLRHSRDESQKANVSLRQKEEGENSHELARKSESSAKKERQPNNSSDKQEPAMDLAVVSNFLNEMRQGKASYEEQSDFWQKIDSDKFEDLLKSFEAKIAGEPWSSERQLELAQLYVLKLTTESSGPLKGMWAEKAEEVWKGVLAVDETNWEAQHNIAVSLSYYPDFLNKTGEAIQAYETLTAFPDESSTPEQSVQAHLELVKLYQKSGRPADMRRILDSGLAKYPQSSALKDELKTLQSQYLFEEE